MRVHRELVIRGDPPALTVFREDIYRSLGDGWTRDADAEAHMGSVARKAYCFSSPRSHCPAATVFLVEQEPSVLSVANIVPHEVHQLSRDEYNAILEEFYQRFVQSAASRSGATAELTDPDANLDRWLPRDAILKLRRFSTCANKRTGSHHPADRQHWYDFLVAAQDADFSSTTLATWLVEEGGWDAERADELAREYEFARGLLAVAGRQRVGA